MRSSSSRAGMMRAGAKEGERMRVLEKRISGSRRRGKRWYALIMNAFVDGSRWSRERTLLSVSPSSSSKRSMKMMITLELPTTTIKVTQPSSIYLMHQSLHHAVPQPSSSRPHPLYQLLLIYPPQFLRQPSPSEQHHLLESSL